MSVPNHDPTRAGQTRPAPTRLEEADALAADAWGLRSENPIRALALAETALEQATALAYPRGVAAASVAKAFAYFRLGRLGDALTGAEAGRDLYRELGDPAGLVRALNTLGIVYGESGNLLGSLEAFLVADSLCKELGDREGEADALNNVANVYSYLGDYVNALDYYQQSLAVCEVAGLPEAKVRALANVGATYFELEGFGEALVYLLQSLSAEVDPDPHARALCLRNLGRCYHRLGDTGLARTHLERSLALGRELGDPVNTSYALDGLATLALEAGSLADARRTLQESLRTKAAAGDLKGQSETLLLLAEVEGRSGALAGAAQHLDEVLAITGRVGNPVERYKAFRQLSELREQQGDPTEALAHYRRYDRLHEEVFRGTTQQQLQGLRLRFEVSQAARERDIYRRKNAELEALNRHLVEADLEKSRLLAELSRLAEEDALTGLHNRRYFDEAFSRAFTYARRTRTPLSVVVSDIDNFKGINDRFSHSVGDAVLRTIAKLMREGLRAADTVARYGGEEFVMLLPETRGDDALTICERLRAAIEGYDWDQLSAELRVTLSIGISDDLGAADLERMLRLADACLFRAKQNGKNQVWFTP